MALAADYFAYDIKERTKVRLKQERISAPKRAHYPERSRKLKSGTFSGDVKWREHIS